ncbi:secretin and TonB N-terminal domain-containing protein, partial [Acinetobacter baumannii]
KTTIFVKNTSVEDALNLVLRTSQLHKKILNESTLLIYSDTEEKKRRYEDLVMRTFYLKSADPKKMQDMVKALIAPKSLYVDER